MLLCDVDGVLTDAGVYMGAGVELKRFDIQDGLGMVLLRHAGIRIGWVSSRLSAATVERAKDLKIDHVLQGKGPKVLLIEPILAKAKIGWDEVCYIGDDIVDLGPLRRAGCGIAVVNARDEVKQGAHYVTLAHGGRGAVREIAEMILKAQNRWEQLIAEHAA